MRSFLWSLVVGFPFVIVQPAENADKPKIPVHFDRINDQLELNVFKDSDQFRVELFAICRSSDSCQNGYKTVSSARVPFSGKKIRLNRSSCTMKADPQKKLLVFFILGKDAHKVGKIVRAYYLNTKDQLLEEVNVDNTHCSEIHFH